MSLSPNPEPQGVAILTLSLAEADRLGYTLGARICAERLRIRSGELFRMLATGALPSVRIRTPRGAAAYRVRPQDLKSFLDRVCVPSPAPGDLIREVEAIEILAGRRERSGSTTNSRIRQRLYAAVKRGDVTRYVLFGSRTRYSRQEVEVLRDELGADGIRARATTAGRHHTALRKRMGARGWTDTRTAAKRLGVPQRTAQGWASRGLYGARKLEGQWWFRTDRLPSSPPSTPHEPPVDVRCDACGQPHERPAWEAREALKNGGRLFCPTCWHEVRDEVTRDNLAKGRGRKFTHSAEAHAKMSDSASLRWANAAAEERAAKAAELAVGHDRFLKSRTRRVEATSKIVRARLGREPTEKELQRWRGRARGRAAAGCAGQPPKDDIRRQLREFLALVVGTYDGDLKRNRILAEVGLLAWQHGVDSFRSDYPAARNDPDCYAPEFRGTVLRRVGQLIGDDVKALLLAGIEST